MPLFIAILLIGSQSVSSTSAPNPEPQKKTSTTRKKKTSKSTTKNTKKQTTAKTQKSEPKTSAEAKKLHDATQKDIRETEAQLKENERSVKTGLNELGKLEGEIRETKIKINNLNAKINSLATQINTLEGNIASNETELARLRDEYLKAVKKMRVSKKNSTSLAFVFSSSNFNQALRRMRYLKEFSQWKDRQTNEINVKIGELQKQKKDLSDARDAQARARDTEQAEQRLQESQFARQNELVAKLKANGEALKTHLAQKQAEANALNNRISALIAEEQRKAEEERRRQQEAKRAEEERLAREEAARREAEEAKLLASAENKESKKSDSKSKSEKQSAAEKEADKKTSTSKKESTAKKEETPKNYADARKRQPRSDNKTSASDNKTSSTSGTTFADMKGNLPAPASGKFKVTSRFGRQSLPDLPDVVYENPGIDAEVTPGTSALAVYAGDVSGIYMIPGYNTVVIVNHGSYYTVYGNIASPSVKVGDKVTAGQALGRTAPDEDDSSVGSIHFEVWRNREKLNPLEWIRI